jgi:hypothetical protein
VKPPQIALDLLDHARATVPAFDRALATSNMIVGFIGHGLISPQTGSALGLCFSGSCIAPKALLTSPQPLVSEVLPDGFAPRAKVVFLAACGLDDNFTAQWHLQPGQALIVPKYSVSNKSMQLDLNHAAWELQSMLMQLAQGDTVQAAVQEGNRTASYWGSGYQYVVIGDGSVNFRAKSQ